MNQRVGLTGYINDLATISTSTTSSGALFQEGHADSAAHAIRITRLVAGKHMKACRLLLLLIPGGGRAALEERREIQAGFCAAAAATRVIAPHRRCCHATGPHGRAACTAPEPPLAAGAGTGITGNATRLLGGEG